MKNSSNCHYAGNGSHTSSYYAASANGAPERPKLQDAIQADVCIVGAGFSGLSTALHLCERGQSVVVLEGAQVGWGASGRNGGQLVNGLNAGLDQIERKFGTGTAQFVGGVVQEGASIIREIVSRYGIHCDLKPNNLFVAFNEKQMQMLRERQLLWRKHGIDNFELLDKSALRAHVNSDCYHGGMLDKSGGHLHPLNLALGEAQAIESLGCTIYEHSRVTHIENVTLEPTVFTDAGSVKCGTLVLCGNAYLGSAVPQLASRVMPVSTQIIATEPLPLSLAKQLLPSDACVEDVRYILDYYRLSADNRLLFGGGSIYGGKDPANIEARLRPNMERVFPELKGTPIEYAWSGNFALSFSRVPQMGQLGPNSYHAMGYSGHGVTGSHLFGRIIAEAISGERERFDQFNNIPWTPFPGGQRFRAPYSTAGAWWYGLRDRLGL